MENNITIMMYQYLANSHMGLKRKLMKFFCQYIFYHGRPHRDNAPQTLSVTRNVAIGVCHLFSFPENNN